jgi:flagellar basal body-associated protein FliL
MWRLRFLPWRWILIAGAAILLLVGAGVALAVIGRGNDKKAQSTAVPQPNINLF